jgi:CRP/FNR family transcriptional regulator
MPMHNQRTNPTFENHSNAARFSGVISSVEITAALGAHAPKPLEALLTDARRVCYEQQEVLYHECSANVSVYFITSGLLKLVTHLPNGRVRIVRLHRPGDVLGLSGLLQQDNRHAAMAVTPVTALRLPLRALQRLRAQDPTTYLNLLERWYGYLQTADTWITHFSTGPIRGRVARLLAFLSSYTPEITGGKVQLLTCEEMGCVLGVTSESVSRILAELKRQHILVPADGGSNELFEADLPRLRDISEQKE